MFALVNLWRLLQETSSDDRRKRWKEIFHLEAAKSTKYSKLKCILN